MERNYKWDKEKAEKLLKEILKSLYVMIDKKWAPEDDIKVSNLINELRIICNKP